MFNEGDIVANYYRSDGYFFKVIRVNTATVVIGESIAGYIVHLSAEHCRVLPVEARAHFYKLQQAHDKLDQLAQHLAPGLSDYLGDFN